MIQVLTDNLKNNDIINSISSKVEKNNLFDGKTKQFSDVINNKMNKSQNNTEPKKENVAKTLIQNHKESQNDSKEISDTEKNNINPETNQNQEITINEQKEINPQENPEGCENIEINPTYKNVVEILSQTTINEDEEMVPTNHNIENELIGEINFIQNSTNINSDTSNEISTKIANSFNEIVSKNDVKNKKEEFIENLKAGLDENMLEELNIESISAETDSQTEDSFMHESPQEQSIKIMLHDKSDFQTIKDNVFENKVSAKNFVHIDQSKIIEQINKQLEQVTPNAKVNVVLNPESLGRVSIQIVKSAEGLSAHFTVGSNEVKDILMKNLDNLRTSLLSQGMGIENLSIKLSDAQGAEYQSDWTEQDNSGQNNQEEQNPNRQEKEKGLFEKTITKETLKSKKA